MRLSRTVFFFGIVLLSRTVVGQTVDHVIASASHLLDNDIVAMIPWAVSNNGSDLVELICVVRQTPSNGSPSEVRPERALDIYLMNASSFYSIDRSSSSISRAYSSDKTSDLILNIYPLGEVNGRLMTIWTTASAHNIVVFAYIHGEVRKVLDVYSKGLPEVIIDRNEQESILVTEMDTASGQLERSTNAITDVYKWNGTTYTKLGRVPWGKRFQCASTESCSNLR